MTSHTYHSRKIYRTRPGVSLLISLILVSILVIFGIGVSNLVISSIRESANLNQANQAYYAAEGGMEVGLLENTSKDAGYDATLADVYYNGTGGKPGEPGVLLSRVKIQGTVPASSKIGSEYVMPRPGTGTAGTGCDPLNPPMDLADTKQGIDNACNWNKIKVGETVGIPLYTTASDGTIKNPADLDLQTLKVKVRTPCLDGSNDCPASGRADLNTMSGADDLLKCTIAKNTLCGDVILAWQIIASSVAGDQVYSLVPINDFNSSTLKRRQYNTEIYEWLINAARTSSITSAISTFLCGANYCVLYETRLGKNPLLLDTDPAYSDSIKNFLINSGNFAKSGTAVINKPVLKLSAVGNLDDYSSPGTSIPYLEYQITTNVGVGGSVPDLAQTVTAEGFSGPFKQVLEVKLPQETGLLEYVIQQ